MSGAEAAVGLPAMLAHPSWRDVVHLAGPLPASAVLPGAVVVPDVSTLPVELHGRLLVVLASGGRTGWQLDALLARARAADAAALLLDGVAPVTVATRALAERLALPVLGGPDPLGAYVALVLLVSEPRLVRADAALRALAVSQRAGEELGALIAGLAGMLGRPVVLLDTSGDAVTGPPLAPDDRLAAAAALRRTPVAGVVSAGAHLPLPSGAVLVASPVLGPGAPSWLAARLPSQLPAETAAVAAALAIGAAAVQQRLALRRLDLERDARRRTSLLGELLAGQGDPSGPTRRRALDLGWRLDGWHTGIRFGTAPAVDVADLRADVIAALEAEGLDPVVVEQGDGWSAWTTADRDPTAEEVQRHAAAVRRAQRRLAATVLTYVGVGRVHAGSAGIGRSLAEAGDAARLAQGRAETGQFLHVDRLGLAQLLLAWTRTDTFQPAARSLLAPLGAESGDLLRTLAAYLDAESNLAETAGVLGVHRNTVAARVTRIQQLLGVELSDPDVRLALHLASRTALLTPHGTGNQTRTAPPS